MSFRREYQLSLSFAGPLLSQASGALVFGVDSGMQRYRKRPVLNGSLVRGNIRHALEEFSALLIRNKQSKQGKQLEEDIVSWFGERSGDGSYGPKRGAVHFDFYWKLREDITPGGAKRTRIAIDEDSGNVQDGAMQVIEDCFPTGGQSPVFEGKITGNFHSGADQRKFIQWLGKALDYIPAMGSFKGIGFGRMEPWQLTDTTKKQAKEESSFQLPEGSTRFGVLLYPDRPFCLGRPRTSDCNRIVSDSVIAGNVIKGLIAQAYNNDSKKLEKLFCFDDLIITHGLPAKSDAGGRPGSLPFSLAMHEGKLKDMAVLLAAPEPVCWSKAPLLQPDWKHEDYAKAFSETGSSGDGPERMLMVRTQIERDSGVSSEGQLFTVECIDPDDYVWSADIELCQVPEDKREHVCKNLAQIFSRGLFGLGKTKAELQIELRDNAFTQVPQAITPALENYYIVTLKTAAAMLPSNLDISAVNSHQELKEIYQQYWAQQHPAIRLHSFYAQQTLVGTWYHQRRNASTKDYYPEWLSREGSVFVLEIEEPRALKMLHSWCRTGLPVLLDIDEEPRDWRSTPFLPEHGYGEILVNDVIHTEYLADWENKNA